MTFQDILDQSYLIFRGKTQSRTPAFGSEKADVVLSIANRKVREWAGDSKQTWASLFKIEDISPVIDLSTFTYTLPTGFMNPSDHFLVLRTTGDLSEVPVTKPQQRLDNTSKVYISGNPKTVTFTRIEPGFDGGTLKAPGYYFPTPMTTASSVAYIDDPDWLTYAVAAELARNDSARQDQFGNLIGIANELYRGMVEANNNLGFGQSNTVPNLMPVIGDQSEDQAFL